MSDLEEEIAQEWLRTHPLAIAVSGVSNLRKALLPIAAVLFGSGRIGGGGFMIVPLLLAIILLNIGIAWVAWWRLRYRVGSSDIKMEKGLISRQARSVPFERIQDVSLEQGLIPRLFGLVEVRFETGAGGKDEMKLAYVTMTEGERLRGVVRDQHEAVPQIQAAATDEQPPAAEPQGQMLFKMGPKRLAMFGVFEFSLIVFAVLGGAAQQLNFMLPFDLWNPGEWGQKLSGPGAWVSDLGWASRIGGALFAVFMLGLLGMVSGIIRTGVRDWDFRLERTAKGFRRRRGLLTKTDVVMPVHRVQAVTMGTGLIRRIWGWHGLSFISLAQDAKSANHVVAPFAQKQEITPIVEAAGFTMPERGLNWQRPSAKYRVDAALWSAVPLALLGIAVFFAPRFYWAGFILLGLAAVEALRQYFLWRYERHALGAEQVLSQRGWLVPKLIIASRLKLHSAEIAQGPIAKRRGYARLKLGLAGGTLSFGGLKLEDAEAMRAAVLDSIAAVDFSQLPR